MRCSALQTDSGKNIIMGQQLKLNIKIGQLVDSSNLFYQNLSLYLHDKNLKQLEGGTEKECN